ncbi:MAG: tyrosine recombinase XerC [Pseudomonadota bacterium]|nr:tyrosine recombinase XerC [Pseudomonadota bacterium]
MDRVAHFLAFLRAERAASAHTLRAYGRELSTLADALAPRPIESALLADLRAHLARGAGAPASLQQRIGAIRTFYRWLVREGVIAESPADRLTSPKVKRPLPRVLEVDEATGVVEDPAGEGWRHTRNVALLEVAYGAGLRVSEVAALDVADVELDRGLVRVLSGKGRKGRIVPIGPVAVEAVRALLAEGRMVDGPLFRNVQGGRLTTRGLYDVVRAAGVKNGLAGVHPHAMRHSMATHLLASGADIRSIQEMLGHASLSTTQRYTQVELDQLRVAHRKAHPRARRAREGGDPSSG